MPLITHRELIHPAHEISPRQRERGLAEKRVCSRNAGVGGSAVVEEEAHRDVGGAGERRGGRVGDEFEGQGRCVVWYTLEIDTIPV